MQLLASPPTQSLAADSALKQRATRGGRRPRLYREQLGRVNKKLGRQACSAARIAYIIRFEARFTICFTIWSQVPFATVDVLERVAPGNEAGIPESGRGSGFLDAAVGLLGVARQRRGARDQQAAVAATRTAEGNGEGDCTSAGST